MLWELARLLAVVFHAIRPFAKRLLCERQRKGFHNFGDGKILDREPTVDMHVDAEVFCRTRSYREEEMDLELVGKHPFQWLADGFMEERAIG